VYIGEFGDVGNGSCGDYNTKLLLYSFLVVVVNESKGGAYVNR